MKRKHISLSVILAFICAGLLIAYNADLGEWKADQVNAEQVQN